MKRNNEEIERAYKQLKERMEQRVGITVLDEAVEQVIQQIMSDKILDEINQVFKDYDIPELNTVLQFAAESAAQRRKSQKEKSKAKDQTLTLANVQKPASKDLN